MPLQDMCVILSVYAHKNKVKSGIAAIGEVGTRLIKVLFESDPPKILPCVDRPVLGQY